MKARSNLRPRVGSGLSPRLHHAAAGMAMVESLIALPVLLLTGLTLLQVALLAHARDALHLAVLEGARAGSVGHAEPRAVEAGLARGLAPLLAAGSGSDDAARQLAHATARLDEALRAGWTRWRQLSPTRESFLDWGVVARAPDGLPRAEVEISVDHIGTEAALRTPATGTAGNVAGAPIGAASGQTLTDAALLRIELVHGVPAVVPLAGRLIAFTLAAIDGCALPRMRRLGVLDLGDPGPGRAPRAWACAVYTGGADEGRPRIPIRVSAVVRMHSNPRLGAGTPHRGALAGAAGP